MNGISQVQRVKCTDNGKTQNVDERQCGARNDQANQAETLAAAPNGRCDEENDESHEGKNLNFGGISQSEGDSRKQIKSETFRIPSCEAKQANRDAQKEN